MDTAYFAIGIHFHQPIGNFKHIFERAHRLCYRPFLKLISDYPDIKMTFHISGCLLDYFEESYPQTIQLIKEMVSRGQIEMMGGGYYEPILTAIPERDIIGQINMMTEYIKKRFNVAPNGMWVPERVWEPHLTEAIYKAGIRYIILDDAHLLRSGLKKEDLYGYFLTGQGKEKIAVFPSDKTLRYFIPFKLPHETIDYFRNMAKDKNALLFTYGDDGEKFGEWPGTHKWVFKENWLKNFLSALRENNGWIKLVHFSDYLKNNKPIKDLRIQQGSYEEMMEWTNGSWSNFISKYPETNQMHKKMLYVSEKVKKVEENSTKKNKEKAQDAKRQLYRGQCNCAYWHGVFGGLYLYHLRSAVYNHLIQADKIADELLHKGKKNWLDIKSIDFYKNSKNGIIIENETFSIFLDLYEGAAIKELDYRPLALNLVNTLSRRKESYHKKILELTQKKEDAKIQTIHEDFRKVPPGLSKELTYDKYSRSCLRDHFIKNDLKMEDFNRASYEELGGFADSPYRVKIKDKDVIFEREAKVKEAMLRLTKQIKMKSRKEIEFYYTIVKKSPGAISSLRFGIEFNITMPYLNSDRYNYSCGGARKATLNEAGSVSDILSFSITDSHKELSIIFKFSKSAGSLWYFPIRTVSQSERAYELNYQCSCILPLWNLDFNKKNTFDLKLNFILIA